MIEKMQPPHIMITASIIIIYNYLFCSSNSFFNLSISASFSSKRALFSSLPYFNFCLHLPVHQSHPSSCQPSALPYSCLISSTLQKNILSTSFGLSKYSLISRRTDSKSGNISINCSISSGVSATNSDRYFKRSSFIFSVTCFSLYCVLS